MLDSQCLPGWISCEIKVKLQRQYDSGVWACLAWLAWLAKLAWWHSVCLIFEWLLSNHVGESTAWAKYTRKSTNRFCIKSLYFAWFSWILSCRGEQTVLPRCDVEMWLGSGTGNLFFFAPAGQNWSFFCLLCLEMVQIERKSHEMARRRHGASAEGACAYSKFMSNTWFKILT